MMNCRLHISVLIGVIFGLVGCAMTPVDPEGAKLEKAKRHFLAGEDAYRAQDYQIAVEEYGKAVSIKNDYAVAYLRRGNVLYRLGRSAEAVADYSRASACFPSYRNAIFNRGEVLRAMGKMRLALRDYHRVQQIDPEYAPVYKRIGYILDFHFEQEDLKALSYYHRALSLGGPDPQVELWVQSIEEDEATRIQLKNANSSSGEEEPGSEDSTNKAPVPELQLEEEEKGYQERLEFLRGILREKLRENQKVPPKVDPEPKVEDGEDPSDSDAATPEATDSSQPHPPAASSEESGS
ncbi:MAG: tetratricopeptide repeat protein [Planctomycetota bacterium]|jgi:tetratricopeptide (TPR) repeat protein|nr:tetratricopeptide repeat protein [Planctomycetota bacterium]